MNRNQIIAIVIGAILIFSGYAYLTQEEELSVTVGGNVVKDPILPASVFGQVEDVTPSGNVFVVSPGQPLTISVEVYNDNAVQERQYHKAYAYQFLENGQRITMWESSEKILSYRDFYVWTFSYTPAPIEQQLTIYVESAIRLGGDPNPWYFDDVDHFDIKVESDAPLDPCEGVSCPSKCVGETYYYSGYCVDGVCKYSSAKVDGKCGYTDPISDPCEGTSCPDICVEPYTFKCNGICVNGECEYVEEANSVQCGYISPTEEPTVEPTATTTGTETPTTTPTATPPTTGEPEDEGIPTIYYIIGILVISAGAAVYIIGSKR